MYIEILIKCKIELFLFSSIKVRTKAPEAFMQYVKDQRAYFSHELRTMTQSKCTTHYA